MRRKTEFSKKRFPLLHCCAKPAFCHCCHCCWVSRWASLFLDLALGTVPLDKHFSLFLNLPLELCQWVGLFPQLGIRPRFCAISLVPFVSHLHLLGSQQDINVLSLPLWVLVCGSVIPLIQRHLKLFSVEEGSYLTWQILLYNIGEYKHRASSYEQGKMDISKTSHTRDWKHHGCRGYSTQWTDTSPNVSWFRKATVAYYLSRFLLQFQEKYPCAASCSLSPGLLYGFSIPQKTLKMCFPLWRTLREHEKSFFPSQGQGSYSQLVQPGYKCQFTNSAPKPLEASWFNR